MPGKRHIKKHHRDKDHAVEEIAGIRDSLGEVYMHFDNTTDTDALDACIYEINALRSRYNTAIKHYRDRYR